MSLICWVLTAPSVACPVFRDSWTHKNKRQTGACTAIKSLVKHITKEVLMQLTRKGYLVTSCPLQNRAVRVTGTPPNLHAVRRQNKGPPAAMCYRHSRIRLTRTDLHRHSRDQRAQHRHRGTEDEARRWAHHFWPKQTPCSRLGHTGHFRSRPSICCTAVEMQREVLTALCARAAHKWKNVNQCGSMLSRWDTGAQGGITTVVWAVLNSICSVT